MVVGFLALVGLVVGVLWALAPARTPRPGASEAGGGPAVARASRLVGDRACRECHELEAARHRRSGHANTLRPAAGIDLARRLDGRRVADPERPEVAWSYRLDGDRLVAERDEAGRIERAILEYALGSGRHATTFVTLTPSPAGSPGSREHRLTYFAGREELGLTPGQSAAEAARGRRPMGLDRTPGETLHCFGCHLTKVSDFGPNVLDPATMQPGIGCERCHGPGADHVAAARRGDSDLTMPFGKVWTADGQMRLCGDCHRHPSQAPPGEIRPDNPRIARFQPVGLMQSACYRKSDGALSCVNCHDPHAPATSDSAFYDDSCLACHKPDGPKPCPTSPQAGCVGCHMPALDAGQGIPYTDHWIRVRTDRAAGAPDDRPAPAR